MADSSLISRAEQIRTETGEDNISALTAKGYTVTK